MCGPESVSIHASSLLSPLPEKMDLPPPTLKCSVVLDAEAQTDESVIGRGLRPAFPGLLP